MKILLLASRIPFPLHNGEDLRIFHFASHLAMNHELHYLGYGSEPPPHEVAQLFREFHFVPEPKDLPVRPSGFERWRRCISPVEMYPFDAAIAAELKHLTQDTFFDVIWVPAWQLVPYLDGVKGVPTAIDVMDDGVLELAREVKHSRRISDFLINLKRLLVTFRFERKFFADAGFCSLVTDQDARMTRRVVPRAKIRVIPNGVDTEYFQPLGLGDDFPSLVFEGNLNFIPSVDAVLYFYSSVFPIILKKYPDTKLYLVGRDPASDVKALAGSNVVVTGFVNDVRPYLDQATVFICPMRKGAGIKNKMLQAWAMAKPVVATTVATAGMPAVHNQNVLIADSAAQFASHVIHLFEDEHLRKHLGLNARQVVLKSHSWDSQARLFEAELKGI